MNEEEARSLNLPQGVCVVSSTYILAWDELTRCAGHEDTLQNWFDTSIFCLQQAEFMRRWDIKSVQAIAVLGVLFVTLGEYHLYLTMWTCALRIAQKLGLDRPQEGSQVSNMSKEGQLRLWWTLIICEWYNIIILSDVPGH